MKTMTTMALLGLILTIAASTAAAMGPLDVQAEVGTYGKYMWRGMPLNTDPVVQPEVRASVAGVGLGVWGSMDTSDANAQEWEFGETHYSLSYGVSAPLFSVNFGFLHYRYSNLDDANTTEVFLSGKAGVLLSPSLTIYQDIDKVKGGYWAAGVAHGVPLNPTTNVELFAGAGLGSQGYIQGHFPIESALPALPNLTGDTSLTDMHIGARVPLQPVMMVTVTPSVTYTSLMGDVKDAVDALETDTNALVWGLSAGFSF